MSDMTNNNMKQKTTTLGTIPLNNNDCGNNVIPQKKTSEKIKTEQFCMLHWEIPHPNTKISCDLSRIIDDYSPEENKNQVVHNSKPGTTNPRQWTHNLISESNALRDFLIDVTKKTTLPVYRPGGQTQYLYVYI